MMDLIHTLFAAFALAAGVVLVGLLVTWFVIDDEPVFAKATAARVTFKTVLQNFLRDVRELVAPLGRLTRRLWLWAGPKLTNPTTWAAIATNFALFWPTLAADPLGQALLVKYPQLYMIGALVALLATRSVGAPVRIPAPMRAPDDALVNNAALHAT